MSECCLSLTSLSSSSPNKTEISPGRLQVPLVHLRQDESSWAQKCNHLLILFFFFSIYIADVVTYVFLFVFSTLLIDIFLHNRLPLEKQISCSCEKGLEI